MSQSPSEPAPRHPGRRSRERGLKMRRRPADPRGVRPDKACPICNADFPLHGDEVAGEEVYCLYCGAPCRLTANASEEACEVEEDF